MYIIGHVWTIYLSIYIDMFYQNINEQMNHTNNMCTDRISAARNVEEGFNRPAPLLAPRHKPQRGATECTRKGSSAVTGRKSVNTSHYKSHTSTVLLPVLPHSRSRSPEPCGSCILYIYIYIYIYISRQIYIDR